MITITEENTELEMWFISSEDKSHYPTGPFGVQMNANVPFKVTNPKSIVLFKKLAKHKEFLRVASVDDLPDNVLSARQSKLEDEEYLLKRKTAETTIKALENKIALLESTISEKDKTIMILNDNVSDLSQYKEKYEKIQGDVENLKKALKKAKKKEGDN